MIIKFIMALLFDEDKFELVQLSEGSEAEAPSVLCENFKWLLDNLENFDPGHKLAGARGKAWPLAGRGKRRIARAEDSEKLGYHYTSRTDYKEFAESDSTKITNDHTTEKVTVFGYPFHVERWRVTAPFPVKDSSKGETYFGGPYECVITSRAELRDGKRTRCYVSCSCDDFRYSFKQDLQSAGYTNPSDILPARGSGKSGKTLPHAPAICKHLYAILVTFYQDFLKKEVEADESADLNLDAAPEEPEEPTWKGTGHYFPTHPTKPNQKIPKPVATPSVVAKKKPTAKAPKAPTATQLKTNARIAIVAAIQAADASSDSNNLEVYHDPRKFGSKEGRFYHKYKFRVQVDDATGKPAIYFVNPILAGSKSGVKVVAVPGMAKKDSYYLFSSSELKQLISQYSTEMPDKVKKAYERLAKKQPTSFMEEVQVELGPQQQLLAEQSFFRRAMLEFKLKKDL